MFLIAKTNDFLIKLKNPEDITKWGSEILEINNIRNEDFFKIFYLRT